MSPTEELPSDLVTAAEQLQRIRSSNPSAAVWSALRGSRPAAVPVPPKVPRASAMPVGAAGEARIRTRQRHAEDGDVLVDVVSATGTDPAAVGAAEEPTALVVIPAAAEAPATTAASTRSEGVCLLVCLFVLLLHSTR